MHTLQGRVRIEVRDTRTRDDHRDVGLENAIIAVDAIRLLRIDQPPPEERPTVNDDPDLVDRTPPYSWWKQIPEIDRLGYGSNGFNYTFAIGNDPDDMFDNWAKWEFDSVDGRYEVQAWIPAQWATAHVQYLIWSGENSDYDYVAGPWLDQQTNNGGWQSLGMHTLQGRVRIEVRDTRTRDDHRDVGLENAIIAVDAIRLLRIDQPPPEERPTPPRSVSAAPHGTNQIRVTWSAPANSGSSPISGYELEYSRPALRNHPLYSDRGPYNSGPVNVNESQRSQTTGAIFLRQVTYTVKVVAINEDGQRSEPAITTATTAAITTTSPTQPRNVDAVANGTTQIGVTWSPPSDTGSSAIKHYTVRYSRSAIGDSPIWRSNLYTTTSTSYTRGGLRPGVTYTVTVTAVNRDNLSSRAATDTATTGTRTSTPPSAPRNVDAVANGTTQIGVTWSPPSDTGSSAIKHYTVRYSRSAIGDSPIWRSNLYTTTSTSYTKDGLRPGVTYTVTVTAVNRDNLSSRAATDTARTGTTTPDGCPSRNKYTVARDGLFPSPHRITSQQQFKTIDGRTTVRNQKGGIVSSGNTNLAQDGCSWIGYDAEVVDGALVSQNALVLGEAKVSRLAKVYGNARVSGNAWVRGEARVSGEAQVTGRAIIEGKAQIYGGALIAGNAHVSGNAFVYGKARIVENIEIDAGIFNGEQEYERAAKALERQLRARLIGEHRRCFDDEQFIEKQVENLLHPPDKEWYHVAETTYQGCKQLEALRQIIRDFTPTTFELVFGYTVGIAGTLKLSLYLTSLLKVLEGVDNMRQIKGAGGSMEEVMRGLEEAYNGLP